MNNDSIKKLEIQLVQSPLDNNGNRAVCAATLELNDGRRFAELGESVDGIEAAAAKARTRVMEQAAVMGQSPQYRFERDPFSPEDINSMKPDLSKTNGGGSKPISPGQVKYITDVCAKKKINPDHVAGEQFGKPLEALQGSEADTIIKMLNGNR